MNYSEALEALKAGKKVCRKGWNGKGMFLVLFSQSYFITLDCEPGQKPDFNNMGYSHYIGDGGEIDHMGLLDNEKFYPLIDALCMKTADDKFLIGWLASQTDMLADDWQALD